MTGANFYYSLSALLDLKQSKCVDIQLQTAVHEAILMSRTEQKCMILQHHWDKSKVHICVFMFGIMARVFYVYNLVPLRSQCHFNEEVQ